jgi:hypothetical protein
MLINEGRGMKAEEVERKRKVMKMRVLALLSLELS